MTGAEAFLIADLGRASLSGGGPSKAHPLYTGVATNATREVMSHTIETNALLWHRPPKSL
jgi:hypothetical protein